MKSPSLTARALLLLPFASLVAWSGNAALVRMRHADAQSFSSEFVVGSMDDLVADSLETGDLVLFTRDLTALPPLAALHTWLLRQRFNPRFDHLGFIYVDRLGRKFVVEETMKQVQCRPYSARILSSSSTEIVVVPLKKLKQPRDKQFQQRALDFVTQHVNRPSRVSISHTAHALIDPKTYHPVDTDTVAPLFPSAALVAEFYEALEIVDLHKLARDPRINKATLSPRHFVATSNGVVLRPEADAVLGSALPIRLH